ncbi:MAG: hypothetical protein WD572_06985 [Gammaproteobacteria bacterium]
MPKSGTILLADADVLIDYIKSDFSILGLVARYTAPVYVLQEILVTVDGLSKTLCRHHGIKVIETDTELILTAGGKGGAMSPEDWLCYLQCERNGWVCVTNDKALIRTCRENDIACRRGLRLMIDLVGSGHISKAKAKRVAIAIHQINSGHINQRVLDEFLDEILDEIG